MCWPFIVAFAAKLGRLDWLQSFLPFSKGSRTEGRIAYFVSAAVEAAKYRQSAILRWAMDALSDSEVLSHSFQTLLVMAALSGGNIDLLATLWEEGLLGDISPGDCIRSAFECSDLASLRFLQTTSFFQNQPVHMHWMDYAEKNQATDAKIAFLFDEAKWLDRISFLHFALACARGDLGWVKEILLTEKHLTVEDCQEGFQAAIRHSKWDVAALLIEDRDEGFPNLLDLLSTSPSHHPVLIVILEPQLCAFDFGTGEYIPHKPCIDLSPPLRGRLPIAHYAANLVEKLTSLKLNWKNIYLDSFCYRGDLRLLKRVVDLGASFEKGTYPFGQALVTSDFQPPSFMRKYLRGVIDLGCPLTAEALSFGLSSCPSASGILFSILTDNEILSVDWMAVLPQGEDDVAYVSYVGPILQVLREKSTELALRNIRFSISPPAHYYIRINLDFSSYFPENAHENLMELMKYRVPLEGKPLKRILEHGPHISFLKGLQMFSESEKVSLLKLSDEVLRGYLANDIRRANEEGVLDILIYFAAGDPNVSSDVLKALAALRRTDPDVIKLRKLL